MARKKRETEVVDDLDGTVEGLARDRFEQEKAAYEERTGEKVKFVPPVPVTRTPIKAETGDERQETGDQESESETVAETEGEGTE